MLRDLRAALGLLVCLGLSACHSTTATKSSIDTQSQEAAMSYVALSAEYYRARRLKDALPNLRRALELDPNSTQAHNVLGLVYQGLGNAELAQQYYQRALELEPANSSVRQNYGTLLCNQEKFQEAEEQFLFAVSDPLNTRPEDSYFNAGRCAARIPDVEKAESYFRKALQVNGGFVPALLQMSILMHDKQNYLSSRAYLQRYLEVAKHTPQSLWLGIRNEGALGDKKAVASYKTQLLSTFPDSQQARLLLEAENQ